jgi:tetratricopeptide (TPR) repeat protein
LRRWFAGEAAPAPFQDGLTGGEPSLLELLDLDMLRAEAKAADIAAGRISARDRPQRLLEAAAIWREIARRTGDAPALRKGARCAEQAAEGFGRERRPRRWAAARLEQAMGALHGAALYGDEGLNAAADFALVEAGKAAGPSLAGMLATAGRAVVEARGVIAGGDREASLRAARRFEVPIRALETLARKGGSASRLMLTGMRVDRAELLAACGARLKDPLLLRMALDGLTRAGDRVDAAFEPLSWARVAIAHGQARAALGELDGDVGEISEAVSGLVAVLEQVGREHSPLDWVQAELTLAGALVMLGDAGDSERAFDQALACYDRAMLVLDKQPALPLRAVAAHARVTCLVRRAEIGCDLLMLAEAEEALREELALADPAKDPVAWAVRQLSFAQICEARAAIMGQDAAARAAMGVALSAALDVFGEHGLRSLADAAARGLERMRMRAEQRP